MTNKQLAEIANKHFQRLTPFRFESKGESLIIVLYYKGIRAIESDFIYPFTDEEADEFFKQLADKIAKL